MWRVSKVWNQRIANIPDRFMWAMLYRSMARHELVHDWHTNADVGLGVGLGRWTRPLSTLILLGIYGMKGRQLPAVDLGSGDGALLRLLRLARYRDVWGIEGDDYLVALSRRNEPRARIVPFRMEDPRACEALPRRVGLVVAFNPCETEKLRVPLVHLAEGGSFRFFYCNPVGLKALEHDEDLEVKVHAYWRNIAVCTVLGRS